MRHDAGPDREGDPFDLQARAELDAALLAGEPPASLLRREPRFGWRRLAAGGGALLSAAVVAVFFALRPPDLVRGAIDHEYYERTLRGSFMDPKPMLAQLGLSHLVSIPGYPQLVRPCEIEGLLAYHLTTFFEHGGMVTVFAFDRPVALPDGAGWWSNVHWRVVTSADGRPLVIVSQQKKALDVANRVFARKTT